MRGALRLFDYPTFDDADLQRRGHIAMSVLRALVVATVVLIVLALFDGRTSRLTTLAFYSPLLLGFVGCAALLQRGRVRLVGWLAALVVWGAAAFSLLAFGGLRANSAMPFVVALTIAGTIAGGRAAVWVGALSAVATTATFVLEELGAMPHQLVVQTHFNGLLAVLVSLGTSAWLLALSLGGLQRALDAERRAAQERDRANARVQQAQRLETVGRLAAGVAHDLSNVLSVVSLAAEGLRSAAQRQPELNSLVEDLAQASDQATLLSRRMVAMSRARGSPMEELEAGRVVEQFAPLLQRLLPSETTLRVERRAPLLCRASRSAIEHIVLNLVLNARDAMPGGGPIDVVVEDHEFQVRDRGVGMSPEVVAHIFQPFFTTREDGTGLGLSNVAELARSMHATVTVDSAPGRGSTFHVTFPEPAVAA